MADKLQLHRPWLVAVWPGMGHVALNAGYYLMSKLGMNLVAELETGDLFDIDHVEVRGGLIQAGRRPRNRIFAWKDPAGPHDLMVFLGEAQPPIGKFAFCRQLVSFAKEQGVERVFTFAAMATQMRPDHPARVLGAATDEQNLQELKRLELMLLEDGHIGGLNGVLLGAAMEAGLPGACLLGEIPHVFAQLPFPKASKVVLDVYATMAGIHLDMTELVNQAMAVERQLAELVGRVEQTYGEEAGTEEEASADMSGEVGPSAEDHQRIEQLFDQAALDRSKAFELKSLLDRLGIYAEYEDRFLDLFKKPG